MPASPYGIAGIGMQGFSERLRLLRQARGVTQVRLAELLGITPRSYNRWERGGNAPQLEMLVKIADVLQVSLDELVGRREQTNEVSIKNHALHELVQRLDELPDADQQALILVMDGLIKKSQLANVMDQRTPPTRSAKPRTSATARA